MMRGRAQQAWIGIATILSVKQLTDDIIIGHESSAHTGHDRSSI